MLGDMTVTVGRGSNPDRTAVPDGVESGSEHVASFEARVRTFMDAHAAKRAVNPDSDGIAIGGVHDASPEFVARIRAFQRALFDAGLAGLTWPVQYGGQDLGAQYQQVFNTVASEYEVTSRVIGIGLGMCGPTILVHGTPEQRERYIRPMLRGDEIWCQLFSEPSAGSDIASVRTRVERTPDGWLVNGQKVWSSVAQHAQFGLLLGRTDASVPKHEGMSMFIVPMDAPGVDVRPLRQMDGGMNFNEVFLTDVRLPPEALVGEVNAGWSVARTTLSNERVAVSGGRQGNSSVVVPLLRLADELGPITDLCLASELVELYALDLVLHRLQARARAMREAGVPPGSEGSVAKLVNAQLQKRVAATRLALLGLRAIGHAPQDTLSEHAVGAYLAAPSASIGGGTDEIQKTIVAERILGLPREPSADKGVPFNKLVERQAVV
jgi:alkylation response protein AidB-like acyl-CoA dehydrogenase